MTEFDVFVCLEFVVRVEADTAEEACDIAARSNVQSEGEFVSGPHVINAAEMAAD